MVATQAARSSGSKVVIAAVTATLTMVGIGSIYLPFFADRDKIRGMHEEKDGAVPTGALLAQEIQKFQNEKAGGNGQAEESQVQRQDSKKAASAPGSMWKNLRRN